MTTSLIVLAAGGSTRMGFPKGLLEVDGKPLLAWHLERFRAAGGERAVVVLGVHAAAYRQRLPELATLGLVHPRPDDGPFSSLLVALRELGRCDVLVQPVDLPPLAAATYRQLMVDPGADIAVRRPRYRERHGHPVALSGDFATSLAAIDPHSSQARLDHLIRALPAAAVASVPVTDAAVLGNWNTPADVRMPS